MEKMDALNSATLSVIAEMILDDALRKFKEQRLQKEIDRALQTGDKTTFYRLAKELKTLR
ncbi:MAG TPA: IDEAL domain-containing protein [Bacilli bacterium]